MIFAEVDRDMSSIVLEDVSDTLKPAEVNSFSRSECSPELLAGMFDGKESLKTALWKVTMDRFDELNNRLSRLGRDLSAAIRTVDGFSQKSPVSPVNTETGDTNGSSDAVQAPV